MAQDVPQRASGAPDPNGSASGQAETASPQPRMAAAASAHLDDWIAIEPDGTVVGYSGKVETGTGVRTALAQIVAEELDVPLERVRLVMGDTGLAPDEGYTAGSMTVRMGGGQLRKAAAEARLALFERASERLGVPREQLEVHAGVISVRGAPDQRIGYGELQGGQPFARQISGRAPHKEPQDYQVIGSNARRVDLAGKFTGAPSFVHDLRLPGMLHGRVVRARRPGARVLRLNDSAVQGAQVIRLGNFIGVVAEHEEQAIKAAAQLQVTWEETEDLPPMEHLYDWMRAQATTDHVIAETGDVEGAMRRAAKRCMLATNSRSRRMPPSDHHARWPRCATADFRCGPVRAVSIPCVAPWPTCWISPQSASVSSIWRARAPMAKTARRMWRRMPRSWRARWAGRFACSGRAATSSLASPRRRRW